MANLPCQEASPQIIGAFCACLVLICSPLRAEPAPGDVFREYAWDSGGQWRRVVDPNSSYYAAADDRAVVLDIDDLEGAARAEVYLELWGGHAGTSDKRMALNDGDWIPVPPPAAIPGDSGAPGHRPEPECYQHFTSATLPLPLDQLVVGRNRFRFNSGGQICHNFGYGQWGVYGVTLRVYYDDTRPHPAGHIVTPVNHAAVGDSMYVEAVITSAGSVSNAEQPLRVDFFGQYEDFDFEGNGIYRQWHYRYRYGDYRSDPIQHHIGTVAAPPYGIVWDTSWVPDQDQPLRLMARITNADGVSYMTPEVGPLQLLREHRSVQLYKPYNVPSRWNSRQGSNHSSNVFVSHDLRRARSARMVLATWNGVDTDAIGINDSILVNRIGGNHSYSSDAVPVPLPYIRPGTNTFFTRSLTESHGIEVLWPGIALLVEYDGPARMPVRPVADLAIFDDALASSWQLVNSGDDDVVFAARLDLAAAETAYSGQRALGVEASATLWRLAFAPEAPVAISGYAYLHVAFRGLDVGRRSQDSFLLRINDQQISLLAAGGIDLQSHAWQIAAIRLDSVGLRFPYIESIVLSGNFTGSFLLDDVRLVVATDVPTSVWNGASPALPQDVHLQQAFPNPFNSATTISYTLPTAGEVEISVHNLAGQQVATLLRAWRGAGTHAVHWDGLDDAGRAAASGVYLYQLRFDERTTARRMVLLR